MTQSQRIVGEDVYAEFITSGGSTIVMSGDLTALDLTFDSAEADLTALGDAYNFMKATTKITGASMTALDKGTYDQSTWGALTIGTEGQFWYYPEGKTNGKGMGGFPCYIKSKSGSFAKDSPVSRAVTLSPQGGTFGTTVKHHDTHTYSA